MGMCAFSVNVEGNIKIPNLGYTRGGFWHSLHVRVEIRGTADVCSRSVAEYLANNVKKSWQDALQCLFAIAPGGLNLVSWRPDVRIVENQ